MGSLRAVPFLNYGSGSIWIRLPFGFAVVQKVERDSDVGDLGHLHEAETAAWSRGRSVTAKAPKAPHTFEKCASKSRLVTEPPKLPRYTLGIPEVLSLSLATRSSRRVSFDGLGQGRIRWPNKIRLFLARRDKYIHACSRRGLSSRSWKRYENNSTFGRSFHTYPGMRPGSLVGAPDRDIRRQNAQQVIRRQSGLLGFQ